ncbi:hypothetical protein L6Q79_00135 [bacterium]|nr:hypothetical protein [bacterium]NUN46095.1 hypothetical protein [bacterium]
MESLQKINDKNNNCLALVIRRSHQVEKTEFFSSPEYSQQIGIIKYSKEGKIKPHYHNKLIRQVILTQEVLVIRKGSVRVDIYDSEFDWVNSVVLDKDDVIFLISGGHGFEMLSDCEMLEIKQGPYGGVTNDKTHFEGTKP